MAGKQINTYPEPDEIVRLVREEHGSVTALAEALGFAGPTLRSHVKKLGIAEACSQAARDFTMAHHTVPDPLAVGEKVSEVEVLRQRNTELERVARRAREGEVA